MKPMYCFFVFFNFLNRGAKLFFILHFGLAVFAGHYWSGV